MAASNSSVESRKERVNIVFIGHVDAGKSTIGGQLMYLTGMVDKRTLEKYERDAKEKGRESWYLSWALDTNEEEREKGKTVEVGRAYFETDKKHFTILDAPGHKSFVPNMISGAAQADLAVLVISARRGEFETGFDRGGQTREHAMLAKTIGVKHMIILVNKMDDPTVNWDERRYSEIQEKLTPYLRKCGFNPKNDIIYMPCSGLTGDFLKERPTVEVCPWYTGLCFLEYIDSLPPITRDLEGPTRAIIANKFCDMGTIVVGKLESGMISRGQTMMMMPNRVSIQVVSCLINDNETEQVFAGDSFQLKLKGIEDTDIMPGFILCTPDRPCPVGRIFDAENVICTIDKKDPSKKKLAKFVKQDDKCILRLESSEQFCMDLFRNFPQMGRFMLRDEGKTIAIGKIVKVVE